MTAQPSVTLDYVGTLENAAQLISRLHLGEKRLVFCDSRLQAELLTAALRQRKVEAFLTHSSLSVDERHQAEQAFRERRTCVIVATSALELGIDVGDLDRVIQVDAPPSVASFLQRMGRTGRRPGAQANCLFLATSEDALLRGAALLHLWEEGFVEPAMPPAAPFHVLAQQCLALVLQARQLPLATLRGCLERLAVLFHLSSEAVGVLLAHLLEAGWLSRDGDQVWIGAKAEGELGHRHFMELLPVFTSPPLFRVVNGRKEIGQVHAFSFATRKGDGVTIVLAGQFWEVLHVDWVRRTAQVRPGPGGGKSRWKGARADLHEPLANALRGVLSGQAVEEALFSQLVKAGVCFAEGDVEHQPPNLRTRV